jgi:hypothetical protein
VKALSRIAFFTWTAALGIYNDTWISSWFFRGLGSNFVNRASSRPRLSLVHYTCHSCGAYIFIAVFWVKRAKFLFHQRYRSDILPAKNNAKNGQLLKCLISTSLDEVKHI